MGIRLDGRDFTPEDEVGETIGSTRAVIINEALARLFWPGKNAVRQKLNKGNEVIGIAGDVRYSAMDSEPVPEVYLPAGLFPQDQFSIVVRTTSDPAGMSSNIRAAIQNIESDVFVSQFQTMDEVIASSVSRRRFAMLLLSVFSLTGVLLAVVGIAGIVAYSLSLRLREVGIRVAMGASPRSVVLLMARQGLAPAFAGLVLGLPLALGLTRFLARMLYGVSSHDPAVFTLAAVVLASVSMIAAGVSAYRAVRVDASSLFK
jgi:ABC-type antimicrobial peptide transport system permease subunit